MYYIYRHKLYYDRTFFKLKKHKLNEYMIEG